MSKKIPNEIIEKLKDIGVKNVNNPSPEEIKIILIALLKNKKLDLEVFKSYMSFISPQVKVLFEGLTAFTQSQEKISKGVLDNINLAIQILGRELEKDLNIDERKAIREEISSYIEKASIESDKQRAFHTKLAYIGGGVAVIAIGAGVWILTKGKNPKVLMKGVEIIGKAI